MKVILIIFKNTNRNVFNNFSLKKDMAQASSIQSQGNPTDTLSHEDMMEWYMRLYPLGRTLESEIIETAQDNHTNYSTAKYLIQNLINRNVQAGRVQVLSKENAQHLVEPYIQLTDLGKKLMWEYLNTRVYMSDPNKYLRILRTWQVMDEFAKRMYAELLYREINTNYNICYKLTTSTTKQELITHYTRLHNKPEDDPEMIQQLNNFLARAVIVGLIASKIQQMILPPQNPQEPPQLVEIEVFYLTDDGRNGLNIFDAQLSQLSYETGLPTSNPNAPKREILLNEFDMPIKKLIKIEVIMSFVYIIGFIIFNRTLNTFFLNTILANIPSTLSYILPNSTPPSQSVLELGSIIADNLVNIIPTLFILGLVLVWFPLIGVIGSEIIGRAMHQKFTQNQSRLPTIPKKTSSSKSRIK